MTTRLLVTLDPLCSTVTNLVLLCRRHHTMQHTRMPWTCRIDPRTRRPEFFDPDGEPPTMPPPPDPDHSADAEVYLWCMARTNIDIDDAACRAVMDRFHFETKREAVNFALRRLAAEPLSVDEARSMRGSGWEGDLDDLRGSRVG